MKILSMIAFAMTALGSMGACTQSAHGVPEQEDRKLPTRGLSG
ncbi:hypothetical protein SAMN02927923_03475 [Microvirga guangxiensis]|uniref:Uncharacterized protein n=1 Tax=Microvirga guangxiensis TaxID=549386 RepID=A0A1G5KQ63_9HYPH|nr:hypothetical protein SAMN02927923_03475 [Microvirga guangxiensis]